MDTTLSQLSSILTTDHFALVVQKMYHGENKPWNELPAAHVQTIFKYNITEYLFISCAVETDANIQEKSSIVGIVTGIDLVHFIAQHEEKSAPTFPKATNGF